MLKPLDAPPSAAWLAFFRRIRAMAERLDQTKAGKDEGEDVSRQ